jgi:hypothetical protein
MSVTNWLVLTSTDWEDDLLVDYIDGGTSDWLCPRYHAVRNLLAPRDRVIFVHGRTRLAHVVGEVVTEPITVVGDVRWGNGRTLVDRQWWEWEPLDGSVCGVPLPAAVDRALRHPANRWGGQNAWMVPTSSVRFDKLAARIARAS